MIFPSEELTRLCAASSFWFPQVAGKFTRFSGAVVVSMVATVIVATPPRESAVFGDELRRQASWTVPSAPEVNAQVLSWLETIEGDAETLGNLRVLWDMPNEGDNASDRFFRFVETVHQVVPASHDLVVLCSEVSYSGIPQQFPLLDDENTATWVRWNLRLLYGRWLADQRFYNEAHQQLAGLSADEVIDPASLIFYQAVVAHRLIDKKTCLDSLSRLVENEDQIPRRYLELARLMQADIEPLESESLDQIARMMRNIENRLDLGRAGQRVRTEEEEVIEKLDKMIDKLEKQAQQSGGGGSSGGMNPFNPAPDSIAAGGKGPGDVAPKAIGKKSGWGNLPPRQRQEALQQISKDFPSHYREVIEEYFKKIAREGSGR